MNRWRGLMVLLVTFAVMNAQAQTTKILGRRISVSAPVSNIAFVQAVSITDRFTSSTNNTTTTASVTWGSGNSIVVGVTVAGDACGTTGTAATVTDTGAVTTFTNRGFFYDTDTNSTQCIAIFTATGITSGSRALTFTIQNPGTSKQFLSLVAIEFSGVAAVRASPPTPAVSTDATSAVTWTTPSITPGATTDAVVSVAMLANSGAGTANAAGGGASEGYDQFNTGSPAGGMAMEYLINSGTSSQTMTGDITCTGSAPTSSNGTAWRVISGVVALSST